MEDSYAQGSSQVGVRGRRGEIGKGQKVIKVRGQSTLIGGVPRG